MVTLMKSSTTNKMPPGPPVRWPGGHIWQFRSDPIKFFTRNVKEYGDLIRLNFVGYDVYQVHHPELIQQVLVRSAAHMNKSLIYKRTLSEYLGNGLLISDGSFWRRQRQLAQPAFHTGRIQAYAGIMTEYSDRLLETWQPGQVRNISDEMMKLTLHIVAKTLFDKDTSSESESIGEALEVLLHSVMENTYTLINLPSWIPTPARRRKRWSIDTLHQITETIISERRQSEEDKGDLLSMLLMARNEDNEQMSDTQVRDEALTVFLAGHETTANALTFCFYLLSQNPDVDARLYQEVSSVLQGRSPELADLASMPYTEQVFKEALRLYPPAWSIGRQTTEELEIGGYHWPAGLTVLLSSFVTQRDARFFPDTERFDPDRFSPENEPNIPKYAYMPFGGGPRICIGNSFAMMEARLILASIVQRYHLKLQPGHPVVLDPLVTLRPRYGMKMALQPR